MVAAENFLIRQHEKATAAKRGGETKALEHDWQSRAGDFELIRRFFSPSDEPPAYRDAAEQYGVSIPQLKSLLHRARLRFRELVEAEVLQTVGEGAELENEVNLLLDSLSR